MGSNLYNSKCENKRRKKFKERSNKALFYLHLEANQSNKINFIRNKKELF